jgi:hypothetical protein
MLLSIPLLPTKPVLLGTVGFDEYVLVGVAVGFGAGVVVTGAPEVAFDHVTDDAGGRSGVVNVLIGGPPVGTQEPVDALYVSGTPWPVNDVRLA